MIVPVAGLAPDVLRSLVYSENSPSQNGGRRSGFSTPENDAAALNACGSGGARAEAREGGRSPTAARAGTGHVRVAPRVQPAGVSRRTFALRPSACERMVRSSSRGATCVCATTVSGWLTAGAVARPFRSRPPAPRDTPRRTASAQCRADAVRRRDHVTLMSTWLLSRISADRHHGRERDLRADLVGVGHRRLVLVERAERQRLDEVAVHARAAVGGDLVEHRDRDRNGDRTRGGLEDDHRREQLTAGDRVIHAILGGRDARVVADQPADLGVRQVRVLVEAAEHDVVVDRDVGLEVRAVVDDLDREDEIGDAGHSWPPSVGGHGP